MVQKEGMPRFTREEHYQLWGWALFTLSAALYTLASIQAFSLTSLVASLIFGVACVIFVIPIVYKDTIR